MQKILKKENDVFEEKIQKIQKIYSETVENQLKKHEINKDLVEISVVIQIPKKKVHIENYLITPTMNMNELKEFVFSYFIKLNDPIQEFNPLTNYLLIIPPNLDKEIHSIINKNNFLMELHKFHEVIVHNFDEKFLLRSAIKSKVVLLIVGDFKIKSDLPPECISFNFAGKIRLDYFSCNTCSIKCEHLFIY